MPALTRARHERLAEHRPGRQLAPPEGEGGVEVHPAVAVALHVHAQLFAGGRHADPVLGVHSQERRHVKSLADRGVHCIQRVGVPLAPGRVRDLGEHPLHALAVGVEAVVEAHRVEQVPEGAHMGEEAHGPVVIHLEVVRAAEPRRRRPPRRPQRHAVEHLRQLGEVQVRHVQAVAELVLDRLVPAVPHPALVQRAGAHCERGPEAGAHPERGHHAVLVEAVAPVRAAVVRAPHAAHLVAAPLGGQAGGGVDGVVVADHADHRLRVDRTPSG